jgi:hypothetical protein
LPGGYSGGAFTQGWATILGKLADPFVINGVVRNWYLREWEEILAG